MSSVPDSGAGGKSGEGEDRLWWTLRQTSPDDASVPADPEEGPPAWAAESVTYPPVPWPRAREALDRLYSCSGEEFLAILQTWNRGNDDFLATLPDTALLSLRIAVELELEQRFGFPEFGFSEGEQA